MAAKKPVRRRRTRPTLFDGQIRSWRVRKEIEQFVKREAKRKVHGKAKGISQVLREALECLYEARRKDKTPDDQLSSNET